jgi:hypothetical protein
MILMGKHWRQFSPLLFIALEIRLFYQSGFLNSILDRQFDGNSIHVCNGTARSIDGADTAGTYAFR